MKIQITKLMDNNIPEFGLILLGNCCFQTEFGLIHLIEPYGFAKQSH